MIFSDIINNNYLNKPKTHFLTNSVTRTTKSSHTKLIHTANLKWTDSP